MKIKYFKSVRFKGDWEERFDEIFWEADSMTANKKLKSFCIKELIIKEQIQGILEEYFGLVEGNKFDDAVKGSAVDQLYSLYQEGREEKPKIIQREYIVTFRDYFDGGDRFKEFASLEEANRFIEIRENCFGKCKGHKGYIISKKLLSTLKKGENNA
jgi:hypothetical protein